MKRSRSIQIFLVAVLMVTLLVGCTKSKVEETTAPDATAAPVASAAPEATAAPTVEPTANVEPVTIKFLKPGTSAESTENARIKAKIEEKFFADTGIKINIDLYYYDWDVISEKFNLDIAAGNAPDVVRLPTNLYFQYWFKGYFQPWDDLVKNNIPNLAKRFSPGEIEAATVKGQIAGFPLSGSPINSILLIRKDKLDEYGLAVPKTLEELEAAMAAFKKANPKQFPFLGYYSATLTYMNALAGLEAFGVEASGGMILKPDGLVTSYYMHPDMKRYLEMANRWYKNGWVSPDFMTAGEEAEGAFIKDQGLTVVSYQTSGLGFFKQTRESVNPKAEAAVVPELIAPWGDQTIGFDGFNNEGYLGIPKTVSPEKAAIIAKFINWELDNPENFWLSKRGEKGVDYEIIDGKMSTPEKWQAEGAKPYNWEYFFTHSAFMNGGDLNYINASAQPHADEVYEQIRTAKVKENPLRKTPFLPLDALSAKFDSATKKLGVLQAEIILGKKPLSAWDGAAKIWADAGGAELEQKITEVYKSLTE